jgi:hypothetical protein
MFLSSMSASHQRSLDSITAAQLLPIAATIVASALGSNIANVMPNPQIALGTILASYIMWGMAVPMALSVLVIYYQRLALHKMPPREVIVSAFLPLGPLGYGGYTVLNLGKAATVVFPMTGSIDPMAGTIAYVMGFFVSLVMWGYGMIWFALALASIWKARPFPFNMGWWGCEYSNFNLALVAETNRLDSHFPARRVLPQHNPAWQRTTIFILPRSGHHLRHRSHPAVGPDRRPNRSGRMDRQTVPCALSGKLEEAARADGGRKVHRERESKS